MKKSRVLYADNPRVNVRTLITDGLGYCCLWRFFSLYHDTGLIAARLGIDERTVRRYKAALREGRLSCPGYESCMRSRTAQSIREQSPQGPAESAQADKS